MHSSPFLDRIAPALARDDPPRLAGDHAVGPQAQPPPSAMVPAAVLVPIVRRPEPSLLLTTRTAHLRHHAGQVAFPGGRIDGGESPVAAALREAREEIGLPPEEVTVLGIADLWQTATGYAVAPVVGTLAPDVALAANPAEVADLFEVPLAHALDPANHQLHEGEWRGQRRHFHVIEWQGRIIWGATAGMLVNLSARLR